MTLGGQTLRRDARRRCHCLPRLVASLVGLTLLAIGAQCSQTQTASDSGEGSTLNGVVLNSVSGLPISRALVQFAGQSVLTGRDGEFHLAGRDGQAGTLRATKPGFYEGDGRESSGRMVAFKAGVGAVRIYLNPEALITGVISGPDGEPLPGIIVHALRSSDAGDGFRSQPTAQANTDSDGQFRLPVPGGEYYVETQYVRDTQQRHEAVLPSMTPQEKTGGSGSASALHVESGTELRLDLHPQLRPVFAVHLVVDGVGAAAASQVEAHLPNGLSFFPGTSQQRAPGEAVLMLPAGTYTLSAMNTNGEERSYGEMRVAVTDHDVGGEALHLTRLLPIAVEVSADASGSDDKPASAQQIGIHFIRIDPTSTMMNQQATYLSFRRGAPPSLTLLPGRYRFQSPASGQWFVQSANVAGTDLMTDDLDIEEGGTTAPLRLVLSKNTGSVTGSVMLGELPAACWIYLLSSNQPGRTPPLAATSRQDGTFSWSTLKPGSYRAIAFEQPRSIDFGNPAAFNKYASFIKTFDVAAGEMAKINLEAVPVSEQQH